MPPASACPGFRAARQFTRRQALTAGSLASVGLSLPHLFAGRSALAADRVASPAFGKAKSCILLFMWGGPSQLDTLDPKPKAPAQIRGPFDTIASAVPGVFLSEHMRNVARIADKLAVIRSLTHDDPAHLSSAHYTLTGHRAPVVRSDDDPPSDRDTPHMGSVVSRLRPSAGALPPFVTVPWLAYHPAAPGGKAPGQHGGWLGHKHDPFLATGDPSAAGWQAAELGLPDDITLDRLASRRELLADVDLQRRLLEGETADGDKDQALGMLVSGAVRDAFDISAEPQAVRERYGLNVHGQCVLLARRLVERGVPLVNVNWHNDGRNFWDTHGDNFNRLKRDLIPPSDQALAALLEDLEERGLLAETIVAWVGEFGRRPRIDGDVAGRAHWPYCYSGILAGGGIAPGQVYGKSDWQAGRPASDPVSPGDYAATIYHALGVPYQTMLHDRQSRPHSICEGTPILDLFA